MFKTGDVLLYQSSDFTKNITLELIRLFTGNKIVHVALYLGEKDDKYIVVEAMLKSGTQIKYLDNIMYRNSLELVGVARFEGITQNLNDYKYQKYIGAHYGILTIINLLIQHGKTLIFPNKKWTTFLKSKNKYICSQVCQLILQSLISFKFEKPANLTEPDDFLKYPWNIIDLKDI